MTDLLKEAKAVFAANCSREKSVREYMTSEQRDALADDYASRRQFLTAAHFHSDSDTRARFDRLHQESLHPKGM